MNSSRPAFPHPPTPEGPRETSKISGDETTVIHEMESKSSGALGDTKDSRGLFGLRGLYGRRSRSNEHTPLTRNFLLKGRARVGGGGGGEGGGGVGCRGTKRIFCVYISVGYEDINYILMIRFMRGKNFYEEVVSTDLFVELGIVFLFLF